MNLALARQSSFPARLWIACLLTAAADFLLFDQVPGISLFIFVCLLAGAIVMVNPHRRSRKQALILKSLVLLIGLLPLIENVSGQFMRSPLNPPAGAMSAFRSTV